MAGMKQRRARGSAVKKQSTPNDEEKLPLTPPTDDASSNDANPDQHDALPHRGLPTPVLPAVDEVAPLGTNVIAALKVVSKLEQLGLDKQEISLPKCIVLGQQSTGKSSVIEAISGIKTPRDTGTCTRCPLLIEMLPSTNLQSAWHATVHLLRHYDVPPDVHHFGMDTEFPGWIPAAVSEKKFFAETDDPNRLEDLIRRAQRATLCPLEDSDSFLDPTFDDRDTHKRLFSPNIVCIAVTKPGLPPLSFFDLPGMIGQAETEEEESTVPLVTALVTKYIQDPEALVLVTCALENDVANSIAAGLARKLKVTRRCMGVLTKPDRLPQGSSSEDLAHILEGRRFQLGFKYFVVKNLDSAEIGQGLTHQDARRLEHEFFSTVAPWATDLQSYQSHFGTTNMQQYLSVLLGNRVMSKLPVIRGQIEQRLAEVEDALNRIPDVPLHTATRTVADVIQAFSGEIRSEMAGEHGHVSWSIIWRGVQEALWEILLKMMPTMSVSGDLDKGLFVSTLPGQSADESILIDSDDDMEPITPSKKRKHFTTTERETKTSAPHSTPSRTPKKPASKPAAGSFSSAPSMDQYGDIATLRKPFKLDEVTRHINSTSRSKVPGQIDPKVREDMMLLPIMHWPTIIDKFFNDLKYRLKRHMLTVFDKSFKEWKGSELYKSSLAIVEAIVDGNLHEQHTIMAAQSLRDEQEGPHIFHEDVFENDKAAVIQKYSQARFDARLKLFFAEYANHYDREMSTTEKERFRKDEKKLTIIKNEPYQQEIGLVADITTYYTIAARRFHDSITMRIESKFFKQLREELRGQLEDRLGIYDQHQGPQNAQRLLAESPERLAHRNSLVTRKKALVEGLQCLDEHYQTFQAQNVPEPAPIPRSNYQRPTVTSPQTSEMEDVQQHEV